MTAAITRILGPECTFPVLNKCEAKFSTLDGLQAGFAVRKIGMAVSGKCMLNCKLKR